MEQSNPDTAASAAKSSRGRKIWAAVIIVAALSVAGGVLGLAVQRYIDRAVTLAVITSKSLDAKIDLRARVVAANTIRSSPQIIVNSINEFTKKQQDDLQKSEEDGFKAMASEMVSDDGSPTSGPRAAKVTLVYFFDSNCPYCKRMEPLVSSITAMGVRVIYREIPILGPTSERAARFDAALWKILPEKYLALHAGFMSYDGRGHLDDAAIDRIAMETLGPQLALQVAAAAAADKDHEISDIIQRQLELSKRAGIHGTPFMMFHGVSDVFLRGAVPAEQFVAAVQKAGAGK